MHENTLRDDERRLAAGRALGALIAADTPALHELDAAGLMLEDIGMAPLLDALPRNNHLRVLNCELNRTSVAFENARLLPELLAFKLRVAAAS